MSRKTIIIIIVSVALILILGLFGFYSYLKRKSASPNGQNQGLSLRDFWPFGNGNTSPGDQGTVTTPDTISTPDNPNSTSLLRHITTEPTAGAIATERTLTTTINGKKVKTIQEYIRYMDRTSGNVYEVYPNDFNLYRISNTTFPKVYKAYFAADGNNLILQNLTDEDKKETINTYSALVISPKTTGSTTASTTVTATSTGQSLLTNLFSTNITQVAISNGKDQFAYLSNIQNNPVYSAAIASATKPTLLATTPLSEWLLDWPTSKIISLTSKPSTGIEGYVYFLNPQTKTTTKILGSVPGLTTSVSPDSSYLFFSSSLRTGGIDLYILNLKTSIQNSISFQTLPEKCVWSTLKTAILYCAIPNQLPSTNNYPDDWYQGRMFFTDSIWKVNASTGESLRVIDLTAVSGQSIDATDLSLSPQEDYLLFNNKRDLTLWGLKLATSTTATSTTSATSSTAR